eukprot:m.2556 g.2556  ORF g.2556 m.2556 type:complete len:140 (-) comp1574_c0_seq1:71-490(-)
MTRGRWRLSVDHMADVSNANNRDNDRNNTDIDNDNNSGEDDNDDVDCTVKQQTTSYNNIISKLSGFIIDALQHHSVFDGCVLRHDNISLEIWCETCRKDALRKKLSGVVIREGLRFPVDKLCWIPPRRRVQRPRTSLLP